MTPGELLACVGRGWQPGIGDPELSGWLTVADYLLCATLALAVAYRCGPAAGRGFWFMLAALLAILAVNKQLDLQTALTEAGRCLAFAQGWYEDRRRVQVALIVVLVAMSLFGTVTAARALRKRARANAAALAGLGVLVTFVLIRAVGIHQVDQLINLQLPGARANVVIENIGIILISANALWHLSRRHTGRHRRA